MPLNSFTSHRPSTEAYSKRNWNLELSRASAYRRATDGCAVSTSWTLRFRQSSFSPIAQALRGRPIHVFCDAPL
jgi:hypothetical protein